MLDEATRLLGKELRKFKEFTCIVFKTTELPSEVAARRRRAEGKPQSESQATALAGARPKLFNLSTYKLHALGDYVNTIRMFGTTDSFTTQIGEAAHQLIKKFYQSTNKQEPAKQLARQERRHTRVRRQLDAVHSSATSGLEQKNHEELSPVVHHNLSSSSNNTINLAKFLSDRSDDPAVKDFIPKLKNHLLSRLLDLDYDGDERTFTDDQRKQLRFADGLNKVLQPKRFQINYTTYDVRRDQDTLWPGHGASIMVLSREDGDCVHPFWYAQVLGAFYIDVEYAGIVPCTKHTMDFLWVRWFGVVPGYHWGFKRARLPKIGFIADSSATFGFLDPTLVIRACHLIPAFADGRTDTLLQQGPSAARPANEVDDWVAYYVNIFADRDMYSRFAGIGVGHDVQFTSPLSTGGMDQHQEGGRAVDTSNLEIPENSLDDEDLTEQSNHNEDEEDSSGEDDEDDGESDSKELDDDDDESDSESDSEGPRFKF
ncbi:hypothetical protein PAXRUDRAFT_14969 [Paxillus rubicundulus Ve08.2h10]|uniref:Uncharacterized protein n=1 Tax=Paxillus rubicundulus Ve08.2h10 TaxID=930991 RepID=A0A0D0DJY2_9AGAM|nr:hypothetical protein PAXRUDRAFT_14969 [Paxillus rubicundulus Ve08.2h10]